MLQNHNTGRLFEIPVAKWFAYHSHLKMENMKAKCEQCLLASNVFIFATLSTNMHWALLYISGSRQKVLKSRDITFPTRVCIGKAKVFPVVMYRCENWIIKKTECQELMLWTVVLEKTLKCPLDYKKIKPKGNQSWIFTGRTDAEAEAPILRSPDVKSHLGEQPRRHEVDSVSPMPKRLWITRVCLFSGLSVSLKNKDYKISNLSFLRINWQYR